MSDYYVETIKHLGLLKRRSVGRYPDKGVTIAAAKKAGPGTYDISTYWDGPFDSDTIKVTVEGQVLIANHNILDIFGPPWTRLDSVSSHRQYIYDRAKASNQFYSKEERSTAQRRVHEYERTNKP